ncbi:MAG: methyl-accepting chemotaxis protein [Pseudomonadota bacterium]
MTLRSQIVTLIVLPFVAMLAIGGLKVSSDLDRLRSADKTETVTQDSVSLLKVVHQLQIERGISAVFLTTKTSDAQAELSKRRAQTDSAIGAVPETARALLQPIAGLGALRDQITSHNIAARDMGGQYTRLIADILEPVSDQLLHQDSAVLAQLGAGLVNFSYAKESSGQQRAVGSAGFGQKTFSLPLFRWFTRTDAIENQLLDIANITFRGHFAALDLRAGLAPTGLPEIRRQVLETGPGAPAPDVESKDWFDRATRWVDSLHVVETRVADKMVDLAAADAANARQDLIITLGAVVVSLVLSGIIGVRLILAFTRQFGALQRDLDKLAQKDFDFEPAFIDSKTEVGELSRSMEVTRATLAEAEDKLLRIEESRIADRGAVIGKLDEHFARLARRDLDCALTETFPEEYEQLRASFNTTVDNLKEVMQQVIASSGSIHNGATEVSQSSEQLSNRTESQASALEETAAALEEMNESVKSAAHNARDVEHTMNETRQKAEASGEVVQNAVSAMTEIESSSKKISQIISLIDDIAFQTNLLALNAGVEAARAGESGKGFAVVASEVRGLAQRSADAATEIKSLITDSSGHVERGVALVAETGGALAEIVQQVGAIADGVSNIAKAAEEQSSGLNEINAGVTELDRVTQSNAAMAEEATAAGHLLHSDVRKLSEIVSQFSLGAETRLSAEFSAPAQSGTGWDDLAPGDEEGLAGPDLRLSA